MSAGNTAAKRQLPFGFGKGLSLRRALYFQCIFHCIFRLGILFFCHYQGNVGHNRKKACALLTEALNTTSI